MNNEVLLSETCPNCGFPKTDCVCDLLTKSTQPTLTVNVEKRRYNKNYTLISGFGKGVDLKQVSKDLKKKLACGGTVKKGRIELAGNHKERAIQVLKELGFKAS